jgi:uncharacterized membrane protein YfcA
MVHLRKGTVNLRLVGWLVLGSVPFAFLGSYLLHRLGDSSSAQTDVERFLGAALLLGAGAMVLRYLLDLRGGQQRQGKVKELTVQPPLTVAIGAWAADRRAHLGRLRVADDRPAAVPVPW